MPPPPASRSIERTPELWSNRRTARRWSSPESPAAYSKRWRRVKSSGGQSRSTRAPRSRMRSSRSKRETKPRRGTSSVMMTGRRSRNAYASMSEAPTRLDLPSSSRRCWRAGIVGSSVPAGASGAANPRPSPTHPSAGNIDTRDSNLRAFSRAFNRNLDALWGGRRECTIRRLGAQRASWWPRFPRPPRRSCRSPTTTRGTPGTGPSRRCPPPLRVASWA